MAVSSDSLVQPIADTLEIDLSRARRVIEAFERFVAVPLAERIQSIPPKEIAARNPFVYAALGASSLADWVDRVVADKLTSTAEGFVGNFLEEVARILCDGTKVGSGVDLQRDLSDEDTEIFAIQSTTNTKNAGGRRSDLQGLDKAAGVLRAQRRHVTKFVAYLFGRQRTTQIGDVTHLSSEDFWLRISGQEAFLPKLLQACVVLSPLYLERLTVREGVLKEQVASAYGDGSGRIRYESLFQSRASKRSDGN